MFRGAFWRSIGNTMVGSSGQGTDDAFLHEFLKRKIPMLPTIGLDRPLDEKNFTMEAVLEFFEGNRGATIDRSSGGLTKCH